MLVRHSNQVRIQTRETELLTSLTRILCKVLEKLIELEMIQNLINGLILNKNQHGFMPRIIESLDILIEALNNEKVVDVILTDFSKACDKLN